MRPDDARLPAPPLAAEPALGVEPARALAARALATFVAPRRLFAAFDERTPWFGALFLTILAAMAGAAAQPDEFFLGQMEDPRNRLGRPVEITSGPAEIVRWGRYLAAFSALAGHPLVLLGLAGGLTLGFTLLGGGRGTFREYLPITAHALLVSGLGTLVAVAMRLASGDWAADPTLAGLIAPLLPAAGGSWLLAAVNPFTVWTLAVLAAGVAAVDGRRSWRSAAAVLIGLYLALALLAAFLTR